MNYPSPAVSQHPLFCTARRRNEVLSTLRECSLNQPYYAGIDEALALLKFGFSCVSLWHFYDADVAMRVPPLGRYANLN